jgi:hypothetical protein
LIFPWSPGFDDEFLSPRFGDAFEGFSGKETQASDWADWC